MSYAQVRRPGRPHLTLIRGGLHSLGALGSDADLATQAHIPVGVLQAIRSVESGGNPSAVRFEPHLFLRRVPGAAIPYTPGPTQAASHVASETNRAAFERARAINEQAAIDSTSWGLYQVLGAHLRNISPSNPVGTFDSNPRGTSDRLLVDWFASNRAAQAAANALNFSDLAYRYNGSRLSPWGARVAAAYARGGGQGSTAALVTATTAVALPWLAAGSAGAIALVVLNHYMRKSRRAA
jgi:hypothetical protein